MPWCPTPKLTRTIGSNYTNNKTNKTEIFRIILNFHKTRIIIRKWEWTWEKTRRKDLLLMTRVSNNRMDNLLKDIQLWAKAQVLTIMMRFNLSTCLILMERMQEFWTQGILVFIMAKITRIACLHLKSWAA